MRQTLFGPLTALLVGGAAVPVSADHHREWTDVVVNHDGAIVVTAFHGLVIRGSEPESFRFLCHKGYAGPGRLEPGLAFTEDGKVLLTTAYGPRLGSTQGCGWRSPGSELEGSFLIGLVEHPTKNGTFFTLKSGTKGEGWDIYRSDDGGQTWAAYGQGIDETVSPSGLVLGPDLQRVYVSGTLITQRDAGRAMSTPKVWFSSDGGSSWSSTPIELEQNEESIQVLGVDPTDPKRVFVVAKDPRSTVDSKDRLLRSTDGGASFEAVRRASSIRGFARDAQTGDIWIGTGTGLLHSDPGQDGLVRIGPEVAITCVRHTHGRLWACGEGFGDSILALGVSDDGGKCFESVVTFKEVQSQVTCPGNPDVKKKCGSEWKDWYRGYFQPPTGTDGGVRIGDGGAIPEGRAGKIYGSSCDEMNTDAEVSDGGATEGSAGSTGAEPAADGSVPSDSSPDMISGGCECRAVGSLSAGVPFELAFVVGLVALCRGRRNRA